MEPHFVIGNGEYADEKTTKYCDNINYMIMNIATYKGKILKRKRITSYIHYMFKNKYVMVVFKDDDFDGNGYYVYISPSAIQRIVNKDVTYKKYKDHWLLVYHVEDFPGERLIYTYIPCNWKPFIDDLNGTCWKGKTNEFF